MTYYTTELPQEYAARGRRTAALAVQRGHTTSTLRSDPKFKRLNLVTYKYHALGDYPNTIRHYGTTDSYNTQIVSRSRVSFNFTSLIHIQGEELEHCRSKRRYPRSGRKKGSMVRSMVNQEAIERYIKKINDVRKKFDEANHPRPLRLRTSPFEHYHIAENSRERRDLTEWLSERRGDPAFKVNETRQDHSRPVDH